MSSEQKFNLSKTIIVATIIDLTAIMIVWMTVANNPSSLKTTVNFYEKEVEIDCTFYEKDDLEN